MASTLPKQSETLSLHHAPKILTAGFNSPVPACTLQVSSPVSNAGRQEFAKAQQLTKSGPLLSQTWFDRFLKIF
jgi:hypothetical protein